MTELPLTDERAKILRNTMLVAISACMDGGFSPLQIGAMMAALSAKVLHADGNAGAVDVVVRQLSQDSGRRRPRRISIRQGSKYEAKR